MVPTILSESPNRCPKPEAFGIVRFRGSPSLRYCYHHMCLGGAWKRDSPCERLLKKVSLMIILCDNKRSAYLYNDHRKRADVRACGRFTPHLPSLSDCAHDLRRGQTSRTTARNITSTDGTC